MIRADLVDEIVAHARRDHPNEACGVIAGPESSERPERLVAMTNAATQASEFYEFESGEDYRLYKDLEAGGEDRVVIYHSHTATEAYPSRTDARIAGYPDAHYVLVSTRDPDSHELRSYRIVDGVVTEEQVEVVETYMFAHTGADAIPDKDSSPDNG